MSAPISTIVVGVAAGFGTLFICATSLIIYKLIKRHRRANKPEITEIESGFPTTTASTTTQSTQTQTPWPCPPLTPVYTPCGGWSALSSTEAIAAPVPIPATPTLAYRPSILKGSPRARRGHKRQNCVRLSTLAPTVLGPGPMPGPRSRSTSPSLIDSILEESPDRKSESPGNGHTGLKLRPSVVRRPSLTPSSPTLSCVGSRHHRMSPGEQGTTPSLSRNSSVLSASVVQRRNSSSPNRNGSREGSLFSIPSLPDLGEYNTAQNECSLTTPTIEFTRPSTEWSENDRSPPFSLEVTPDKSTQELYDPASPLPPQASGRKYDPSWLLPTQSASSKDLDYDPDRPISVYSSDGEEGSSPTFPFAVDEHRDSTAIDVPPPSFPLFDRMKNSTVESDADKENYGPSPELKMMSTLQSPFECMPIFPQPTILSSPVSTSVASPASSPSSSPSVSPPPSPSPSPSPDGRNMINQIATMPFPPSPNSHQRTKTGIRASRRNRASSPSHSSGISKVVGQRRNTTVGGPRQAPAKDVRKSIMMLRRMNSMIMDEDEGLRRWLRMGRQEGPEVWGFGGDDDENRNRNWEKEYDRMGDIDERGEQGGKEEERATPSSNKNGDRDSNYEGEGENSRAYTYTTYSASKPTLSLITTVATEERVPRQALSVWEAGEAFWEQQERVVEEAVTRSPIETPTSALRKVLEGGDREKFNSEDWIKNEKTSEEEKENKENGEQGKDKSKRRTGEGWNKRQSRVLETPKSAKSLYDPEGFLRT